jgi:hypothetical protein
MSPVLPPGTARVVLLWGARPSDLDIYMLAPHADPTKEACEVRWLPLPASVGGRLVFRDCASCTDSVRSPTPT